MVGLKQEGFRGCVMNKHPLDQSQECLSTWGGSSGLGVDSLALHPPWEPTTEAEKYLWPTYSYQFSKLQDLTCCSINVSYAHPW